MHKGHGEIFIMEKADTMKKRFCTVALSCVLLLGCFPMAAAQSVQQESPMLVGHIAYSEGSLLRYVPENRDWAATVKDAPLGVQDTLYADENTRAEFILPNSTRIRIGGSTQIQIMRLDAEVTEVDIASGKARLYNRSSSGVVKATTPFGHVVAPAQAIVDLYVGDESVEALCIKGSAHFIHAGGTSKYDLSDQSASIVAGQGQVSTGDGRGDSLWQDWNDEQDRIWERRFAAQGDSQKYLPEQLHDEAYTLEENGRWEQVSYGGRYHSFWRPAYVHTGWAPFTAGRWTRWYGDNCWIPDEPFGYITHHYGSWVYVDSRSGWYWAPPLAYGVVGPSFGLSCAWYPGRVSWIYSDMYIGWVPLMPYETYYCSRYWGPASVVVIDGHGHKHKHHHDRHAVLVGKGDLYRVRNYDAARVRRHDRNGDGQGYQKAAFLNDNFFKNLDKARDRFKFNAGNVSRKPHDSVLERVRKNIANAQRERKLNAAQLREKIQRLRPGTLRGDRELPLQRISNKIVSESEVAKPRSMTKFKTRELKRPAGDIKVHGLSGTGMQKPAPGRDIPVIQNAQPQKPDTATPAAQRPRLFTEGGKNFAPATTRKPQPYTADSFKPETIRERPAPTGRSGPLRQQDNDRQTIRPPAVQPPSGRDRKQYDYTRPEPRPRAVPDRYRPQAYEDYRHRYPDRPRSGTTGPQRYQGYTPSPGSTTRQGYTASPLTRSYSAEQRSGTSPRVGRPPGRR